MSLANEAGYLYVYSKKLASLNKKLHILQTKVKKRQEKHQKAPEHKKERHTVKLYHLKKKLEKYGQSRQEILAKLRHHQIAFVNMLQREGR